jgi:multiple sugar transport system substrate-binding protein
MPRQVNRRRFLKYCGGALGVALASRVGLKSVRGQQKITLNIAAFKSPGSESTTKLVSKYLAANPQIENVVVSEYPYDDLRSKLVTEFVGRGTAFDIVTGDCIWLAEFVSGKHLRRIDQYFTDSSLVNATAYDLDDFVPPVLNYLGRYPALGPDNVGTDHQKQFPLYAIPWLTNTESLLVRRDLYDKYVKRLGIALPGDTAATAWTFDHDFIPAAKALTGTADSRYGMSMQVKRGNSVVWEYSNLLHVFGAAYFDAKLHPTVDTPEMLKLLKTYIGFYRDLKVAPPEATGWEHAEDAGALASGYCAMKLTWNHELNGWIMNPGTSKFYNDFETHWMVLTQKNVPTVAPSVQGGYFMAVPVYIDEARAKEAFKFIVWLTSKDIHKEFVLMGPTPARMSTMRDPEVLAKWPWITTYRNVIHTPFTRTNIPEWSMIEYNIAINLSRAMIGEMTPEAALKDLQDRLYFLMQRAGYY